MYSEEVSIQGHEKIERLRDRMLQCPICMDEYKDPRILPCHHTVCFNCLTDFINATSPACRVFRCPQCRADVCVTRGGVKDFPPNFYINCIQDEIGSRPYIGTCNICERDWLVSQYRCIDCDFDICRYCVHEHKLFTHAVGRQPNIMKIETGNLGVNGTSEKNCSEHKEEALQMYCLTCDIPICVSCICEKHRKHDTMTLAKKLQLARKHLQFDLDKLQIDVHNTKATLTRLHEIEKDSDKAAQEAIVNIEAYTKVIIEKIAKAAEEKVAKVKAERGKYLKEVHDYEKDLATHLEHLNRGTKFLGDLQEEDMCLELLTCIHKYKDVLVTSEKTIVDRSVHRNLFRFLPGKVFNRFGCLWVGKSNLIHEEDVEIILKKENNKQSVMSKLFKKISVFRICCVLTVLSLFVGMYQFVESAAKNGGNLELYLCLGLYAYMCIAGFLALQKSHY
ncbi:E3 ubiquitin-protein ligase TRIM56-like [Dreissena polymorpha]|uniref:Uncharacterized protein n=1 Tax=Dreissena polymorpha TaxID=45954 RepID=A0A9D4C0S4_DREPO|nr:E3 ubiquitin-protein ligase TRIM56-like [Dreissena polymorpha]KAH3715193.1 hypothetical protein DPMN_057899 [Dreissena polymorpha]